MNELEDKLLKMEKILEALPSQSVEKLSFLVQENTELKQHVKKQRTAELNKLMEELKETITTSNGNSILCAKTSLLPSELTTFANGLAAKLPHVTLLLAIEHENKCQLLLKLSDDLSQKGIKASDIMTQLAPLIQGSGGGKGASAQAGGTHPQGIEKAFALFKTLI